MTDSPLRHDRACRRDRGQATVEFALCLPLIVVMVLGMLQILVVARDQIGLELAAREGARAAAVSADPRRAATAAARRVVPSARVTTSVGATTVTVTVTTRARSTLPIVGGRIRDVRLTAHATMALEPPDDR